jgi:sugar O-acyltransferase (sialic acid O-acetyltransferase NeuD family)
VKYKRKLFIIGASSLGREIESWLELIPSEKRDWEIAGFLHSFKEKSPLEGYSSSYSILGSWEDYPLSKEDYCLIAVSNPLWRKKLYLYLENKSTLFTFIAPNATIGKYNKIGDGSIICPNSIISTNVNLGKCVFINFGSQIGHDVNIGDFTSIMTNIDIAGNCTIGSEVFIGSNSVIIPKIKVEENSVIGVGSVVINNVKKGTTVFGNPAKVINF